MSALGMIQRNELHKKLWSIANDARGNMELNSTKDYILTLIFYKYISDRMDFAATSLQGEPITLRELWDNAPEEDRDDIRDEISDMLGYFIEPHLTYESMVKSINSDSYSNIMLQESINSIYASTEGRESFPHFRGLFSSMKLNDDVLGKDELSRSRLIAKMIVKLDDALPHVSESNIDIFGDAYEYLMGMFAAGAGKKGGEFYTPRAVSLILARIVTNGRTHGRVYDPTCGSGSLMLTVGTAGDTNPDFNVDMYACQEKVPTTYNLTRQNLIIHAIDWKKMSVVNDDTLTHPGHTDEKFDMVVSNPPYSLKWDSSDDYSVAIDDRFTDLGGPSPKQYADLSFVQHDVHKMDDHAVAAIVLPHGVLFRGGAEARIRKALIEQNLVDAIIGLPANIFYGTGISTVILVLKKNRENRDILFVDASDDFVKATPRNYLSEENVSDITSYYLDRNEVDRKSYIANHDEIVSNDYNLNITRYVDGTEVVDLVDMNTNTKSIDSTKKSIDLLSEEISNMLKALTTQARG